MNVRAILEANGIRCLDDAAAIGKALERIEELESQLRELFAMKNNDPKSSYYSVGGIEVIDVVKSKLTAEQFEGFLLGNALKYLLRANHKGDKARDVEKACVIVNWLRDATSGDDAA